MDFMKKISEISKRVGVTATETYKTVADKSGKLLEEAKIKIAISDKEADIEQIYIGMGKTVFDMFASGEDVGKVFSKECKNINKIVSEIEEMNRVILFNKKLKKCDNCGEIISIESSYCDNCGEKQKEIKIKNIETPKKEEKKESIERVCPTCGLICDANSKFCAKCGYKF